MAFIDEVREQRAEIARLEAEAEARDSVDYSKVDEAKFDLYTDVVTTIAEDTGPRENPEDLCRAALGWDV